MVKFGASPNTELLYHGSPLDDLLNLFKMDAAETFFSREWPLLCCFLFPLFASFLFLLHRHGNGAWADLSIPVPTPASMHPPPSPNHIGGKI